MVQDVLWLTPMILIAVQCFHWLVSMVADPKYPLGVRLHAASLTSSKLLDVRFCEEETAKAALEFLVINDSLVLLLTGSGTKRCTTALASVPQHL